MDMITRLQQLFWRKKVIYVLQYHLSFNVRGVATSIQPSPLDYISDHSTELDKGPVASSILLSAPIQPSRHLLLP